MRSDAADRSGRPTRGSLVLAEALSLWRGHAYEECTYEPFAAPEVERLEELRLAAVGGTDAERPGDLVVGGCYTTRSSEPAIENTAAPAPLPVIPGVAVVLPGSVSCIPFQARGPDADLPFDPNGQRSSGQDPICVGG